MRIIAGKLKGRSLKVPTGNHTRPTTDRHRETMFNVLGQFFDGGSALDVFAGSGALGLEAYSRGIDQVTLIEKNTNSFMCIKHNIEELKVSNHVQVLKMDAFLYLNQSNQTYDLIFLDPPYHQGYVDKALAVIESNFLLKKEGIILVEVAKDEEIDIQSFQIIKEKQIGNSKLIVLT